MVPRKRSYISAFISYCTFVVCRRVTSVFSINLFPKVHTIFDRFAGRAAPSIGDDQIISLEQMFKMTQVMIRPLPVDLVLQANDVQLKVLVGGWNEQKEGPSRKMDLIMIQL